mgnify:CR=1 FL=1
MISYSRITQEYSVSSNKVLYAVLVPYGSSQLFPAAIDRIGKLRGIDQIFPPRWIGSGTPIPGKHITGWKVAFTIIKQN